ncbi:MAG: hypothetical protein RIC35_23375 [Marinoscillum sp.]
MDPFEYVVVLQSLILGLGIAQLLTGSADVISNLKNVKPGFAHSFMVFNIFLMHLQEWWYSYQYGLEITAWTLPIVIVLLIYPILLFILARMLFPTGLRGNEKDLKEYFFDQWQWFYAILVAIPVVSMFQNVLISGKDISLQIPQFAMIIIYSAFILTNVKSVRIHNVFQVIQTIIWIGFIVFDPYTL